MQFTRWYILNVSFVMLLVNSFVLRIWLQHKLFPLLLQGLHHPFLLFIFFSRWTLSFRMVFWPIMSLKFLFLLKAIIGFSLKMFSNLGLIFNMFQCLLMASLIFGNWVLYVKMQGIFALGVLSLYRKSSSLSWLAALSIWSCISVSL